MVEQADPAKQTTRRTFLQSSAAALAATASASLGAPGKPARPNILLIMVDQYRGDALGADGNTCIKTPNLDRLAGEGARFCKAYSSLPSCPPARASLLTGMSPWGHGLLGYAEMARQWRVEQPRLLHDAGYYALTIGKNHFWPMRNSHGYDQMQIYDGTDYSDKKDDYGLWLAKTAPGIDEHSTGLDWNGRVGKPWPHVDKLHPTYWTAQESIDFLNGYKDEKPFFLKMSFHRPHSPYDPPGHWFDFYKDADLPKPVVGQWAQEQYGSFTSDKNPDSPRGNLSQGVIRNSRQGYYGSISFVDEQVGRVMDVLKKLGKFDNTLILFVADHGDMLGDHHLWRKTFPYEASTRIPMIVRWPDGLLDAKRGRVLRQLVELRDVLPTFLDAAGVAPPSAIEGKSMLDLIRGKTDGWRTQLDLEHSQCYFKENVWTGLTDGHFKYIYYAVTGRQQLFDLDSDPGELTDLAPSVDHADTLRTWRGRMIEHLTVRGPRWVSNGDLMLRPEAIVHGANFPT